MATPPDEPALFLPTGDGWQPTVHARGPWDPRHQHGGAAAALMARCLDCLDAPGPMRMVRLTVNLLRPVPLTRLTVRTRVSRPGRRVQLLEAVLLDGDTEVVRAEALRLRDAPVAASEAPGPEALPHLGVPTAPLRPRTGSCSSLPGFRSPAASSASPAAAFWRTARR